MDDGHPKYTDTQQLILFWLLVMTDDYDNVTKSKKKTFYIMLPWN